MMNEYQRKENPLLKERKQSGPVKIGDIINSFNDKIAIKLTNTIGSMKMFWFMAIVMTLWMAGIGELLFHDPYPFSLMLLIFAGVFQALAMVAIMVGQNILSKASDALSEMTYKDAEAILDEVEEIHEHLHHQDEILKSLLENINVRKNV
jgi:uncharacterized membrane protein